MIHYGLCCLGTGNTLVGEINEQLLEKLELNDGDATEFYMNTGGIYLHRRPIPFDGTILAIMIFGFTGEQSTNSMTDLDSFSPEPSKTPALLGNIESEPFLFVLVYRPGVDGTMYELIHGPTQMSNGLVPRRVPFDLEVQEGDFVGVYIPRECVNGSDTQFPQCPSQVNVKTDGCLSAFFHPGLNGVDSIPVNEFQEVSVQLNMIAVLSPAGKHC